MALLISSIIFGNDNMRKMTLEYEPFDKFKEIQRPIFEKIVSYEILDDLRNDWEEFISVDLIEIITRAGISIDDIRSIGTLEILNVLGSKGNKHICMAKELDPENTLQFFKDLDLITAKPNIVTEDKITLTCIGDNDNLNKFISLINEHLGKVVNVSFQKAIYQKQDILSVLTEKQKDMLLTANRYGYYEYPRKINSTQLSDKVSISKPTLIQHLRKAENRILKEILTGQS